MPKPDISNKKLVKWIAISAVMVGIIYTLFFLLLWFNQKNITIPAPPDSATYSTPTPIESVPTRVPTSTSQKPPQKHLMCPMLARQCPDGSYVSASGPNCEFAKCPTEK